MPLPKSAACPIILLIVVTSSTIRGVAPVYRTRILSTFREVFSKFLEFDRVVIHFLFLKYDGAFICLTSLIGDGGTGVAAKMFGGNSVTHMVA